MPSKVKQLNGLAYYTEVIVKPRMEHQKNGAITFNEAITKANTEWEVYFLLRFLVSKFSFYKYLFSTYFFIHPF